MTGLEISSLYREYLKVRKSPTLHPIQNVREYIANSLSSDDLSNAWYRDKMESRGYGFGKNYEQVALAVENKYLKTSLAESWRATEQRMEVLNNLRAYLNSFDEFVFGFAGGSLAWRQYLDLSLSDMSDLDITIVITKYNQDINFESPLNRSFVQKAIQAKKERIIDMYKLKFPISHIDVSLHVWTMEELEIIQAFDFEHTDQPLEFVCLRDKPSTKQTRLYGPQHNFIGDQYYLPMNESIFEDNLFTSTQHIVHIGEKGELVLGEALDMMIFKPIILGGNVQKANDFLALVQEKLRKRKIRDNLLLEGQNCSFVNLPSRKSRMPSYFLHKISELDHVE